MKYVKPLIYLILPTVLFYGLYESLGMLPAMGISVLYSAVSMLMNWKKSGSVANTQVLGGLSNVLAIIAIAFGGSEKLMFVPALVQNVILMVFFIILSLQKKSVVHYIVKDFDSKAFANVPEEKMLPLNIAWIVFFALKILSKAAGIFLLDFKLAYWLIFLLGDPAMAVMVLGSLAVIRSGYASGREKSL